MERRDTILLCPQLSMDAHAKHHATEHILHLGGLLFSHFTKYIATTLLNLSMAKRSTALARGVCIWRRQWPFHYFYVEHDLYEGQCQSCSNLMTLLSSTHT